MLDDLETTVPPLGLMGFAIAVSWLVSSFLDEQLVPGDRGAVLGLLMMVAGVGVALSAVLGFRGAKTSVDPLNLKKTDALVVAGVYRFTRNPMYLGMLCIVIGIGLWLGSLVATAAGGAVFVSMLTRLQIIPEERALAKKFGAEYEDFMQSVRRWV